MEIANYPKGIAGPHFQNASYQNEAGNCIF
jgi:hypothetical protein